MSRRPSRTCDISMKGHKRPYGRPQCPATLAGRMGIHVRDYSPFRWASEEDGTSDVVNSDEGHFSLND